MRGYFLQNAEKVSENLTFFPDMGIWTKKTEKKTEKFGKNLRQFLRKGWISKKSLI